MRYCFSCVTLVILAASLNAASYQHPKLKLVVRPDSSGRLVRSVVAPAVSSARLKEVVDEISVRHDLDPQLVHSVIRVESNYNPYAVSSKGALGLMQLIPGTARRFGVANVFDPVENIQGGVRYLKHLLALYNGNYPLALAAYNAGEGAVSRHGGIPPYPETRSYVHLIGKKLGEARAASSGPALAPVPESKSPDAPNSIREIVDAHGRVRYVTR